MTIGALFLGFGAVFTLTDNMISLLWFPIFGIIGGLSLGALNSRKARTQPKYKNEYTSYAAMSFMAVVLLGLFFLLFASDKVDSNLPSNSSYSATQVIFAAIGSGLLAFFGVGLTVANAIAEE